MDPNRAGPYGELAAELRSGGEEQVVLVFIPALVAILLNAERQKGEPLRESEVLAIRDQCACMAVSPSAARSLTASRDYDDIDPEHAWSEWQRLRVEIATADPE